MGRFSDLTRFVAVAFGAGDYRMRTEERPPPPKLSAGDRLALGPLAASVEGALGHPRLIRLRFAADRASVLRGLVSHGRPIQYAHQPEPLALGHVCTKIAADPIAFEPPSAGFALDWRILARWRERGVAFATLSHAAGLSSTGDAMLDRRFPLDEFFRISGACASAVQAAKSRSGRVIAVGTSVVRALESAADADGTVRVGEGAASGHIARGTKLRVADAILTGVHQPGESHYEPLRAFADDRVLDRVRAAANERGYRAHEFGDLLLLERGTAAKPRRSAWLTGERYCLSSNSRSKTRRRHTSRAIECRRSTGIDVLRSSTRSSFTAATPAHPPAEGARDGDGERHRGRFPPPRAGSR